MNLFEINGALRSALDNLPVDAETGEIQSDAFDAVEKLQIARDEKILAIAGYIKEHMAMGNAITEQIKLLEERRDWHEMKASRLEVYIAQALTPGETLENAIAAIKWRKSEAVNIKDASKIPEHLLRIIPEKREPDKIAIKTAIKTGTDVPGAEIITRHSLQIK